MARLKKRRLLLREARFSGHCISFCKRLDSKQGLEFQHVSNCISMFKTFQNQFSSSTGVTVRQAILVDPAITQFLFRFDKHLNWMNWGGQVRHSVHAEILKHDRVPCIGQSSNAFHLWCLGGYRSTWVTQCHSHDPHAANCDVFMDLFHLDLFGWWCLLLLLLYFAANAIMTLDLLVLLWLPLPPPQRSVSINIVTTCQ